MTKKYIIKKSFAYMSGTEKVYVRKHARNEEGLFIADKDGYKTQNIVELSGDALKVGKKCKAIEEVEE